MSTNIGKILLLGVLRGVKPFHQAALAAGGVIFVNNTFFRCFVQSADGIFYGFGCFRGAINNSFVSFGNVCAGSTTENAVAKAFLFILFIALDCRLDISQLRPPNNFLTVARKHFTRNMGTEVGYSLSNLQM